MSRRSTGDQYVLVWPTGIVTSVTYLPLTRAEDSRCPPQDSRALVEKCDVGLPETCSREVDHLLRNHKQFRLDHCIMAFRVAAWRQTPDTQEKQSRNLEQTTLYTRKAE